MKTKQYQWLRKLIAVPLSGAIAFSAAAATSFSAAAAAGDGSEEGIIPSEHEFSVIGQFNSWDDDLMMSDENGDGVYEAVIEDLSPGDQQLKIRMDRGWGNTWGATDEAGYSTGDNYVVTVPSKMDVLVTFDTNYDEYSLWRVHAEPVDGSDSKYDQNVGKYKTMSLFGTLVGNYDEDVDMEYTGNGEYSVTFRNIEAGSYETVVRADHAWDSFWGVWNEDGSTAKCGRPVPFSFDSAVTTLTVSIDTSPDSEDQWVISYSYTTEDGKSVTGIAIASSEEPLGAPVINDHSVGVVCDLTDWGSKQDLVMEKLDDDQYYAELKVPSGYNEFYFKTRLDNSWDYSWGEMNYSTGYAFGNDAPYVYLDGKAALVHVWFYTYDSDYRCWYMQWDYEYRNDDESVVEPDNAEKYYYFDDERVLHILPGFEKCKGVEEYFSYNDDVFSVIFEDGVTAVPDGLFDGCQELEAVQLAEGLVSIGRNAFRDCDKLSGELILPETVENIGESAFAGCRGLSLATVEVGITTVPKGAFANCTGLTEVELSSNLRKIESAAFRRCQSLREVTIRPNVTEIANNAFAGCSDGLVIKGVPGTEAEAFAKRAGFTFAVLREFDYDFEDDGTIFITKYNGTDQEVTVPAAIDGYQVTRIGACAFMLNDYIVGVEIPRGVKTIGMMAFNGCSNLQYVSLPEGLTFINGGAFMDCGSMVSVYLPDSLTAIGPHAFAGCSSLERLNEVYDLESMGAEVFNDTLWYAGLEDGPAYFGNVLIGYKGEAEYGTTLEIREGTVGVAAGALAGSWGARGSITAVTFPESLTYVEPNAFWEMHNYTEIYIPENVTRIEEGAFGCYWDEENSAAGHVNGVVIHGTYDSAAEKYAEEYGFEFAGVDDGRIRNISTVNSEKLSLGSRIVITGAVRGSDSVTYCYYYKRTTAKNWTTISENTSSAVAVFTPKACADYDVKVVAADATGAQAEKQFVVSIVDGKSTAFTNNSSVTPAEAKPDTRIYFTGSTENTTGDVKYAFYYKRTTTSNWTVIGTEYDGSTTASFKPRSEGKFDIKIDAIDGSGELVSWVSTLIISENAGNLPVNTSTVSADTVSSGTRVYIYGAAERGAGGYTYTYQQKKSTSTVWSTIAAGTDSTEVSFKPKSVCTYDILVTVKDSAGAEAEKAFTITVTE